ncbi:hypothetical protein BACCIP111899_04138 [Bacillus rhizoplanae]|uniref:Uncharacterized protein n=1 Tax=Bacillus rhizoplanae TaxID=2880966 RepID=A0ABN8A5P9_9BACI|nr:hypothetical protein BACCIP111899_04138 [Bacillus rhizoplanae]
MLQLQKRKVCNKKDIRTVICLNIFLGSSANKIDYNKKQCRNSRVLEQILYQLTDAE